MQLVAHAALQRLIDHLVLLHPSFALELCGDYVGGVGLIDDAARSVSLALKRPGNALVLIGATEGHLGASLYLREIAGSEDGAPPPVDLTAERRHGDFVRGEIGAGGIAACHDLGDGGLRLAVAEMAMAGDIGAEITLPPGIPPHAAAFGEDQARYILETTDGAGVIAQANALGIPALLVGHVGGDALTVTRVGAISTQELKRIHEAWLPEFMAAP